MTSIYNYLFGSNTAPDIKNEPIQLSSQPGTVECNQILDPIIQPLHSGVLAFNNLNHTDSNPDIVKKYVNAMIIQGEKDVTESGNYELLTDVFLLAIYKRAISTKTQYLGEGRRMVYYDMILELYKHYPLTTLELLKETPTFGCWVDLYKIWKLVCQRVSGCYADAILYTPLVEGIIAIIYNQLIVDFDKTNKDDSMRDYSLLIKWFARENSHYDINCYYPLIPIHGKHQRTSFSIFAILIRVGYVTGNKAPFTPAMLNNVTGNSNCNIHIHTAGTKIQRLSDVHRILRQYISDINKEMCNTETLMCSGQWEHIVPATVPVKCMKKNKLAMLNELSHEPVTLETFLTGNRYPDNIDRVTARKNLIIELKNGTVGSLNATTKVSPILVGTVGSLNATTKVSLRLVGTVGDNIDMMDMSNISYGIYRKELDKWARMKPILFAIQEKYFSDYVVLDNP